MELVYSVSQNCGADMFRISEGNNVGCQAHEPFLYDVKMTPTKLSAAIPSWNIAGIVDSLNRTRYNVIQRRGASSKHAIACIGSGDIEKYYACAELQRSG